MLCWGHQGKHKPALRLLQAYRATQQLQQLQNVLQSSIRGQVAAGTYFVEGFIVLPVDGNADALEALR